MLNCTFCRHNITKANHNKKHVNVLNYCEFDNPDLYEEDVDYCKYYEDVPYNPQLQEIKKPLILMKESVRTIPIEVRTEVHINFKSQQEYVVLDEIVVVLGDLGEYLLSELYLMEEYSSIFDILIKKLNFRTKSLALKVYQQCLTN